MAHDINRWASAFGAVRLIRLINVRVSRSPHLALMHLLSVFDDTVDRLIAGSHALSQQLRPERKQSLRHAPLVRNLQSKQAARS